MYSMCIEDIAISRRTYVKATPVADATATRFAANPDRLMLAVTIGINGTSRATIARTQAEANSGFGIVGADHKLAAAEGVSGTVEVSVDYRRHGAIVADDIWVVHQGGTSMVYEIIMQDDLAHEVREFVKDKRAKHGRS